LRDQPLANALVLSVGRYRNENGSAKVCHGSGGIVLLRAE
jgi:hypothetical protein